MYDYYGLVEQLPDTTSSGTTPASSGLVAVALGLPLRFSPTSRRPRPRLLNASMAAGNVTWPLTLNITAPSTVTLQKQVGKLLTLTSASTVTLLRQAGKALTITSPSTVSLAATVFRFLMPLMRPPLRFQHGTGKPKIQGFVPGSITIVGNTFLQPLTIVAGSSVSLAKQVSKILPLTSNSALTLVRQVGKIASLTGGSVVSIVRQVSKNLSLTSASVVSLTRLKVILLALTTIVSGSSVGLVRQVGKMLGVTAPSTVSAGKAISRMLATFISASSVGLTKQVGKILSLSSGSVLTLTRLRVIIVNLPTITSASAVTLARQVGKVPTIATGAAVSVVKSMRKTLAFAASATLSIVAGKLFKVALTLITSASSVSMSRWMIKTINITAPSVVSVVPSKIIGHILDTARRIVGRVTSYLATGRAGYRTIGRTSAMQTHDPYDFIQGTSWQEQGPILDALGNPLDLTGSSLTWKLDSLDGATNYINIALNSGITITDAATATVLVDVPKIQTASVQPGIYRDVLLVTLTNGDVLPVWGGVVRVSAAMA